MKVVGRARAALWAIIASACSVTDLDRLSGGASPDGGSDSVAPDGGIPDAPDAPDAPDGPECLPVTQGLIGHYTFDSTAINGTQVLDRSGMRNDGVLGGDTLPVIVPGGRWGDALAYPANGVGYVTIPSLPVDRSAGATNSISLWFYRTPNSIGSAFNDTLLYVPSAAPAYDIYLSPAPALCFNTASADCWGIPADAMKSRWVHVVALFYNGPIMQSALYIDGQSRPLGCRSFDPDAGTGQCTASRIVATPLVLGGDNASYPFRGRLDDVRIYNRAVTEAEVKALYAGTACP